MSFRIKSGLAVWETQERSQCVTPPFLKWEDQEKATNTYGRESVLCSSMSSAQQFTSATLLIGQAGNQ